MRIARHFFLLLVFVLIAAFNLYAQENSSGRNAENSDQLWLQAQINKELPKKFTIGLRYRLKLENQFSQFRAGGIYGIVGYKVNKYLALQVRYKFFSSRFKNEHTFFAGITGDYRYKDFKISLRSAYQRTHEYFNKTYEPGHEPVNQWRNRLQLSYDLHKRWGIYASAEPYFVFDTRYIALQRIRTITGVNWKFAKYSTLNLSYTFQPKFDGNRPVNEHILGLAIEVDLPKKFKKKKKSKNNSIPVAPKQ